MRCSTLRGNDLTKLNRQVQLWVCPRFEPPTPHLCISYTGRKPAYLLSFIPSASCRSNSFTILSPSPLLGVKTPQQVQATSDRSRISTKACSPITCVTGCATKSQPMPHIAIQYLSALCRYQTHFLFFPRVSIHILWWHMTEQRPWSRRPLSKRTDGQIDRTCGLRTSTYVRAIMVYMVCGWANGS